jgi:putative PIN family toxin of toxin-antitoxin system
VTRIVIDPSVFVSALIGKPGSAPDIVVRAFIDDRIEVVVSPLLAAELERVLARPKFRRYIDHRPQPSSSCASNATPRWPATRRTSRR